MQSSITGTRRWQFNGTLAGVLTLLAILGSTPLCHAGAFVFAGEANGVDIITHPTGYTGTGVSLTVDVCIDSTSANAANMVIPVQNIVNIRYHRAEIAGGSCARPPCSLLGGMDKKGAPAVLMSFVDQMLGIKSVAIDYQAEGRRRSFRIPNVAETDIEALAGQGDAEVTISNAPLGSLLVTPGWLRNPSGSAITTMGCSGHCQRNMSTSTGRQKCVTLLSAGRLIK